MTVTVPDNRPDTEAAVVTLTIRDTCPECGGPRGVPQKTVETSKKTGQEIEVDWWRNPCGHKDYYEYVLDEAQVA